MTSDHLVIEWCHNNAPPPETVIDWSKVAIQSNSTSVRVTALRESTDKYPTFSPIVEKKTLNPENRLQYVEDALMFVPTGTHPVSTEGYLKTNLKYDFSTNDTHLPPEEKKEETLSDIQIPIEDSGKTKLVLPGSPAKRVKLSSEEELPVQIEKQKEEEEDKMELQVEEDNMDLQVEEEDKMELEVLSHSSEVSPEDDEEDEKSPPPADVSNEIFNLYPIDSDDEPPTPDEYEDQNETETPAVKNKPTRNKKQVKRYEDEQTPPGSEAEEDENGKKIEKVRKFKKGEIVVLQDAKPTTIKIAMQKDEKHKDVSINLIENDHVTQIIKEKSQYKFNPLPNFTKFEANAVIETPEFKVWTMMCKNAYISALFVVCDMFNFRNVTKDLPERGIKRTLPFSKWCETVTETCKKNLPELTFCQREAKEEGAEPTMPILNLVFQYQQMIVRDFSKHVFFVKFSLPLEPNIPDTRAFKVDYHTYFQLKALYCAIHPLDLLIEIWINWLKNYIEKLMKQQSETPAQNPKEKITMHENGFFKVPGQYFKQIFRLLDDQKNAKNILVPKAIETFKIWWWYQSIFKCNFVEDIVNASSGEQVLSGKPVFIQY